MREMVVTSTRELVLAEWRAAQRFADQRGALNGTPGVLAGQYLEMMGGDAQVAALTVPVHGAFFERVREVLLSIHREEKEAGVQRRSNVVPFARKFARAGK